MPHNENQDLQLQRKAEELQRAEEHEVFKYREEHPAYQHRDPLRKRSHQEADKLKKKQRSAESRISSLERKLKKEKNENECWKIELQIKKEKLKLALLTLQEKQKRMTVLPEQLAVKTKVEMDSLKEIIGLRREIIEQYGVYGVLSEEQEAEILKQQEALQRELPYYEKTTKLHEKQVALVMADTRAKESVDSTKNSDIIREFRTLRVTEQELEEETIRENPEQSIRRAHLIRKMKQITNYRKYGISEEDEKALRGKLADLQDYQSFIREVFRKEGIDIFTWDLRFSHTAEQMGRRVAFLAGRRHRMKRFYASRSWNAEQLTEEEKKRKQAQEQEEREKPIVEQRLSFLEEELHLQQDPNLKIAKSIRRPINVAEDEETGTIVKADLMDTIGTMNRFYEKCRLEQIFDAIKKKSKDRRLMDLEERVLEYTRLFRQPGEDRFVFEKKEQDVLNHLMQELQETITHAEGETKRRLSMLYTLMNDNQNGELEVPEDAEVQVFEDNRFKLNGYGIMDLIERKKWKDRRKDPLFPHAPTLKDISQGTVGDCYLLAGLIGVLTIRPETIRECMKDNGDGTVTVRFYRWDKTEKKQQTRYYTVTKTTVCDAYNGEDSYAEASLWVQMMEKAFLASGLPHNSKLEEQNRDEDHKITFEELRSGVAQVFAWHLLGGEASGIKMFDLEGDLEHRVREERRQQESRKQNPNPNQAVDLYTASENAVYEDLNAALRREDYIFFSAKHRFKGFFHGGGLNGEEMQHGLAARHVYGVLGTKTREINGKVHKFVLIMNPWGNRGRVYRVDKNKDFGKAQGVKGEPEEGIVLLELRDFIDCGSAYRTLASR